MSNTRSPLLRLPEELLELIVAYGRAEDLRHLTACCRDARAADSPRLAQRCTAFAYSPTPMRDYGTGRTLPMHLPLDDDATGSWRRRVSAQVYLESVLRRAELIASMAGASAVEASVAAASTPATPVGTLDHQSSWTFPRALCLPPPSRVEVPKDGELSVFDVHLRALFAAVQQPVNTAASASAPPATAASTHLLLSQPHMLPAFAAQLCEIHDRHQRTTLQQTRAYEERMQGMHFTPWPLAEDEEDEDVHRSSHEHSPLPYIFHSAALTFNVPPLSASTLQLLVQMMQTPAALRDPRLQSNCIRALAICALCDRTRTHVVTSGALDHTLAMLARYASDADVTIACAWALVVFARPLGAAEGSMLYSHMSLPPVHDVGRMLAAADDCVPALTQQLQRWAHDPRVLTKLFWSLVNIASSLREDDLPSLATSVIEGMRRFPAHRQLTFRALFALVNITLRPAALDQLVRDGLISLLLTTMENHPLHWIVQCQCVLVLRHCAMMGVDVGQVVRSTPGAMRRILRLYLHCLPESIHPTVQTRERVMHLLDLLGTSVEAELASLQRAADEGRAEPLGMIPAAHSEQLISAPEAPPDDDDSSPPAVHAAAADVATSPQPVNLSPAVLLHDRGVVQLSMAQRRARALCDWHDSTPPEHAAQRDTTLAALTRMFFGAEIGIADIRAVADPAWAEAQSTALAEAMERTRIR